MPDTSGVPSIALSIGGLDVGKGGGNAHQRTLLYAGQIKTTPRLFGVIPVAPFKGASGRICGRKGCLEGGRQYVRRVSELGGALYRFVPSDMPMYMLNFWPVVGHFH